MNLTFIKPDTCVVERLFSLTNKVWVEGRKSMTPAHTELLLLLKCNRELWDAKLVYKCRSNPRLKPVVNEEEVQVPLVEQLDNPGMEGHAFAFMQRAKMQTFGTTITSPQCLEILIFRHQIALNCYNLLLQLVVIFNCYD